MGILLASFLALVLRLTLGASASLALHDEDFVPDHVIRVTSGLWTVGCETRLSALVNGTSPGPEIRLQAGKVSWIRVYNDMTDRNLTMHWHGLAQRMAPFADGSPLASQWPIPPGRFFDYEVQTLREDAGTYFYHSHVGLQAFSVTAPLIVDDCGKPPYDYDDERTFILSDYFNKTDATMEQGLLGLPFKWTGETNAVLINGLGIGVGHAGEPGPAGGTRGFAGSHINNKTEEPHMQDANTDCTLPVIDVDPGKTYRFRFIGATGLSMVVLAFESHPNLTVIGVDGGEYTKPASTERMQLASGQRFDILFKTKTIEELQADGNRNTYYFQYESRHRPATYQGYGVLRYNLSAIVPAPPPAPVLQLAINITDWLEYTLAPLHPEWNPAPSIDQVTRRIVIDTVQMASLTTNKTIWQLAHLDWTETSYQRPLLVDIYERGDAAIPNWNAAMSNFGWDPQTKSFPVRVGEVLEIVLQNRGSLLKNSGALDSHPFHLHGTHFHEIGSGDGEYDAYANELKMRQTGYTPVLRDTTILYRHASTTEPNKVAGWRAWRIKAQQPGVWMMHCHVLQHMVMGMQSVWVVGDATQIKKVPADELVGYYRFGGDVYGDKKNPPEVYEAFNPENSTCHLPS